MIFQSSTSRRYCKTLKNHQIWQKMKKDHVQVALTPFFGWFQVPENLTDRVSFFPHQELFWAGLFEKKSLKQWFYSSRQSLRLNKKLHFFCRTFEHCDPRPSAGDQDCCCCYHGSLFISTLYLDDFLFSLVIFFGYANQLSLLYIDSDMYQQHVAMYVIWWKCFDIYTKHLLFLCSDDIVGKNGWLLNKLVISFCQFH